MIYSVSQHAPAGGDGSTARPFQTIRQAAAVALPGDTVLIHEGIYREWVAPPRGGESDDQRIVYQAAEGERPVITGAEPISGWTRCENGIWRATVNNVMFGEYNPYADELFGDWYDGLGQTHHTGELFADGQPLDEAASLPALMDRSSGKAREWFALVEEEQTVFHAHFGEQDPNSLQTEISVRPFCFFPKEEGINYITLSGLECCCAATQWAPPTAFQPGAVGPHWSRGWVIENCRIHDSKCCGVSLGKNHDPKDNSWSKDPCKGGTQTYTEMVFSTLQRGWSRELVGEHTVRGNEIWNCGQAGIVGCMGGAFCDITENHIHHINIRGEFYGAEIAGIKLHAAVDTHLTGNVIHHCSRGVWLDWQAQGAIFRNNLCFGNDREEDLFIEVCHGPCLVENNLLLSARSFLDMSQGTACVHNLFGGKIHAVPDTNRFTLYHLPHSTQVGGVMLIYGGDDRFFNNLFVRMSEDVRLCGSYGTDAYDSYSAEFPTRKTGDDTPAADLGRTLPMTMGGNAYLNGTKPWVHESGARVLPDARPALRLVEENGHFWLENDLEAYSSGLRAEPVTAGLLGRAFQPDQPFEDRDGAPLRLGRDLLDQTRASLPRVGPLEHWPARLKLI